MKSISKLIWQNAKVNFHNMGVPKNENSIVMKGES